MHERVIDFSKERQMRRPESSIYSNLALQPSGVSKESQSRRETVIFDLSEKRAEKSKRELSFTPEWLISEVEREKQKPQPEGETPWYHLAGTGFWVKEQVAQLLRNTRSTSGKIAPDVLERELGKVEVDMKKFEDEYLKQMLSLRWNLDWKTVDGQKRVICPDYADALWEEVTDKKEREGAVFETLFGDSEKGKEGVEGWLRDAPTNSFAIIVSPKGWSGLTDADHQPIEYPETQVYAIKTLENGGLQAFTFRYDATNSQNEDLQKKLGLEVQIPLDKHERIKTILGNTALVREDDSERPVSSFEDIVDLMQESVGGRAEAYNGKTFEEIKDFLKNPEKYSASHPQTASLIEMFQEYARMQFQENQSFDQLELNLQIGQAIAVLQQNKLYRKEEEKQSGSQETGRELSWSRNYRREGIDYRAERLDLKKRPGCAGGGAKQVTSMGSSRTGLIIGGGSGEDYNFDETGVCVKCDDGPKALGPCKLCMSCDAELGGKAARAA